MAEPMGLINLVCFTSKWASTELLTNAVSRVDLRGSTMHFYVGVTPADTNITGDKLDSEHSPIRKGEQITA